MSDAGLSLRPKVMEALMPALTALVASFVAPAASHPARGVGRAASRVWAGWGAAWRRSRGRARIAGLDARMLRDIGATWAEAEHEANKRFWQL